ncbi:SpvB/TcaC N-terminal domain-containing protein [Croceimicrobium sp.]|uniref:SpvB/TcaC N-terminal domain-containing protein n=1 Tax=Croceimicrobium sp. TaxID=2828340 RepID=UPI003BAD2436
MITRIASLFLAFLFLSLECNATISYFILNKAFIAETPVPHSKAFIGPMPLNEEVANTPEEDKALEAPKPGRNAMELNDAPAFSLPENQKVVRGLNTLDPINAPYNDFLQFDINTDKLDAEYIQITFEAKAIDESSTLSLNLNLSQLLEVQATKTKAGYSFSLPTSLLRNGRNKLLINDLSKEHFIASNFSIKATNEQSSGLIQNSPLKDHGLVFSSSENQNRSLGALVRSGEYPSIPQGFKNFMSGESAVYLDSIELSDKVHFVLPEAKMTDAKNLNLFYFDEEALAWQAFPADSIYTAEEGLIMSAPLSVGGMYFAGAKAQPASSEGSMNLPTSLPGVGSLNPFEGISSIAPPSINQKGSATTAFPIKMPPGRAGLAPSIALNYNSDSKTGILGVGWNVPISSIELDTRWGTPRFDANLETEVYSLDGESLSMEGGFKGNRRDANGDFANRSTGTVEFFPKTRSSWQSIKRFGTATDEYFWVVTTADQTKMYYGSKDGSTLDANTSITDGSGNLISWKIARIEDKWGNYIDFEYENFVASGSNDVLNGAEELLIKQIRYTGFEGSTNIDPPYLIEFNYKSGVRADARVSYRTTKKLGTFKILESISVAFDPDINTSGDEEEIRNYTFGQTSGDFGKILLSSITENVAETEFYTYDLEYFQNDLEYSSSVQKVTSMPIDKSDDNASSDDDKVPYADDLRSGFEYSPLGASYSGGFSLGGLAGVGLPDNGTLSNSIYGTTGFGRDYSYGRVSHQDINGDGLPDLIIQKAGATALAYYPGRITINGTPYFGGKKVTINSSTDSDLNRFQYTLSKTSSVGVGAVVDGGGTSGFLQYDWNWVNAETSTYTNDVNGDGILDIIENGKVSFGTINPEDHNITYETGSSTTPNPIFENAIISRPSYNDDEVVETEVVRSWRALKDGTISISNSISLDSESNDGIKVSIEHQTSTGESRIEGVHSISPGSTANYPVNNISVAKGDLILFRATGNSNTKFDLISWNPDINYTTGSILNADQVDWTSISAEQGFLLSDLSFSPLVPNTEAFLTFPNCSISTAHSDTLTFSIRFKGVLSGNSFDDVFEYTVLPGTTDVITPANFSLGQYNAIKSASGFDFSSYDEAYVSFTVSSPSNVDWKAINWRPVLLDDPAGTGDSKVYPTVKYEPFERTALLNAKVDISNYLGSSSTDIKLEPSANLSLASSYYSQVSHTDPVSFKIKIKTIHDLIKTYKVELSTSPYTITFYDLNLASGSNTAISSCDADYSISRSLFDNDEMYISAITDDPVLAPLIAQYLKISLFDFISTYNEEEDLYTYDCDPVSMSSYLSVFYKDNGTHYGPEYLGWGQFGWKADINTLIDPDQMNMGLNANGDPITNAELQSINTTNLESTINAFKINPDLDQNPYKPLKAYRGELEEDTYFSDFGTLESSSQDAWVHPFNPIARILKANTSLGSIGEIPTETETSISNQASSSTDKPAPSLRLKAYNTSISFGGSVGPENVSVGSSMTMSTDEWDNDKGNRALSAYFDINGDSYPDEIFLNETLERLEVIRTDAMGGRRPLTNYGEGVTILRRKFGTTGISNSAGTTGEAIVGSTYSSRIQLISGTGVGGSINVLTGESIFEEGLLDLNGDGLTDWVDQTKLNDGSGTTRFTFNTGSALNKATLINWPSIDNIEDVDGLSIGGNLSAGIGGQIGSVNVPVQGGISLGILTQNQMTESTLIDMNADGLPDRVSYDESGNAYLIYLNMGTYISSTPIQYSTPGNKQIQNQLLSYQAALNVVVGISGTLAKIVVGTNAVGYLARNNQEFTFKDVNGDGFPDFLSLDENDWHTQDEMDVYLCTVKKSNLLKKIKSPTGSEISLNYQRVGNKYGYFDRYINDYQTYPTTEEDKVYWDMPFSQWTLFQVNIYDGFVEYSESSGSPISDGADNISFYYLYDGGVYDRRDREFLGFSRIGVLSNQYLPNTDFSHLATNSQGNIAPAVSADTKQQFLSIQQYPEPTSNTPNARNQFKYQANLVLETIDLVLLKEVPETLPSPHYGQVDPNNPNAITRAHLIKKQNFDYDFHAWNQTHIDDDHGLNEIYLDNSEFFMNTVSETACLFPRLNSVETFTYVEPADIGETAKFQSRKVEFTYNKYGDVRTAVINGMDGPGLENWNLSSTGENGNIYDRSFVPDYKVDLIAKFDYYAHSQAANRVGQLLRYRLFTNDTVSSSSLLRRTIVPELSSNHLAPKKVGIDNDGGVYSYSETYYNAQGLTNKIILPDNHQGDSKEIHISYDSQFSQYPETRIDRFIPTTGSSWDETSKMLIETETGLLRMLIDPNGQKSEIYYDDFYRPLRIFGPRELADPNAPYTIAFEYWSVDPSTEKPWAIAKQYLGTAANASEFGAQNTNSYPSLQLTAASRLSLNGPAWNSSSIVRTALMTDGLGRSMQSQQEVSIYNPSTQENVKGRRISGPIGFDNFGNLAFSYLSEATNTNPSETTLRTIEVSDFASVLPASINYTDEFGRNALSYSVSDYIVSATRYYTKSQQKFFWDDLVANPVESEDFITIESTTYGHTELIERISLDYFGQVQELVRGDILDENVTQYSHDPIGQLLSRTNPAGISTSYSYDRMGRVKEELHADKGKTSVSFDLAGNMTQTTFQEIDENGVLGNSLTINYEYEYNRLSKKLYPESDALNDLEITYGKPGNTVNAIGRILNVKQGHSGNYLLQEQFRYNENGQIIREKRTIAVPQLGVESLTTDYVYDSWGRIRHMRYPDGEKLVYHYAAGGDLEKLETNHHFITDSESYYLEFQAFDGFGQPLEKDFGNGVESNFTYDAQTGSLKVYTLNSSANNSNFSPIGLLDKSFDYDATGNISSIENISPALNLPYNSLGGAYNFNYNYDDLNQLSTVEGLWEGAAGAEWNYNLSLSYDLNGRITSKTQTLRDENSDPHPSADYNLNYGYSNNLKNGVTSIVDVSKNPVEYRDFEYNGYGSLTKIKLNEQEELSHLYDEEQRLRGSDAKTGIQHNVYDPYGIRIMKAELALETVYVNNEPVGTEYQLDPYIVHAGPHYLFQAYDNVVKVSKHYYGIGGNRVSSRVLNEPRLPEGYEPPTPGEGGGSGPVYGKHFNDFDPDNPNDLVPYNGLVSNNIAISAGLEPLFTDFGKSSFFTAMDLSSLPEYYLGSFDRDACSWGTEGGEYSEPPYNASASDFQNEFCLCIAFPEEAGEYDCDLFPEIYWYHGDGLGNVEYLTDLSGTPFEYFWYSPSGEPIVHQHQGNAAYSSPYQFTAQTYDGIPSLVYMGARYYSPKYSIFTSVDPMAAYRSWISPYNYVQNNPIMRHDPTGMLDHGPGKEPKVILGSEGDNNPVDVYSLKTTYDGSYILFKDYSMCYAGDATKERITIINVYQQGENRIIRQFIGPTAFKDAKEAGYTWEERKRSRFSTFISVNNNFWENNDRHAQGVKEVAYELSSIVAMELIGFAVLAYATRVTRVTKVSKGGTRSATKGGAGRAAQYSSEWGNASLKKTINRFAPGSKGVKTSTGKTVYKNSETGIQVVVDDAGNYFRIENTNLTGKRKYLDLDGNIPNNKVVNGKTSGRTQGEYNQATHFNIID